MVGFGATTFRAKGTYEPKREPEKEARFHVSRCFVDLLAFLICPFDLPLSPEQPHIRQLGFKRFHLPASLDGSAVDLHGSALLVAPGAYSHPDILKMAFDSSTAELVIALRRGGNIQVGGIC